MHFDVEIAQRFVRVRVMPKNAELVSAAKRGDYEAVAEILKANPGLVAAKDDNGVSALLLAIYHGHPDIAKLLATGRQDLSIFEATVIGDMGRLEELLDAIPEAVNAVSPDGFTPLGFASYFGSIEAITLLLARGANPNVASKNGLGVTPLHSALAGGQSAIALLLLDGGANVDQANKEGWTPLHYTADIGDAEIAALLLEMGADSSKKDKEGRTAAQLAADVGHDHVADVIFQAVGVE